MAKLKQTMTLVSSKHIASNVLHVSLKPDTPIDYIPGQFITLHFYNKELDKDMRRSYSIANPPGSSENLDFAISYQPEGVASEAIFHMSVGDTVDVSGPAGRLVLLDNHPKRYVLIATGTGVTPYRSMLNQLNHVLTNDASISVLLLFGIRNQDECLYYDDFIHFADTHENFDVEFYYSRQMPTKINKNQHQGYVQTGFDKYSLDPEEDMIYLCGNPNMIDQAYTELQNKGFNARNVRREKYISSK